MGKRFFVDNVMTQFACFIWIYEVTLHCFLLQIDIRQVYAQVLIKRSHLSSFEVILL